MEEASPLAIVVLPLAIAVIMGSLGLSLTPDDFKRVFVQPRAVLIGLANLLVLSPLLAFAAARLWGLEAGFAVGLVLLGASPGGAVANLITHLARGDTALSISMTALSSVAAVAAVPFYLGLALSYFDAGPRVDPDMLGVVARVFAITIIPLSIGMRIRARRPDWAGTHQRRALQLSVAAFVLVVVGAVADEWGTITRHFGELALAALSLNVAAMAGSFAISRLAKLSDPQATAVAMELGIHNGALAIAVGLSISPELAIPAAVYSAFQFLTAGAFARAMYRRNLRSGSPGSAGRDIVVPSPS